MGFSALSVLYSDACCARVIHYTASEHVVALICFTVGRGRRLRRDTTGLYDRANQFSSQNSEHLATGTGRQLLVSFFYVYRPRLNRTRYLYSCLHLSRCVGPSISAVGLYSVTSTSTEAPLMRPTPQQLLLCMASGKTSLGTRQGRN